MAQRQNPKERKTTAKQPRTSEKSITKEGEPPFPEDQFRLMVEAVVDYAIYMLDPEGRIMSWNAGAQRLKGYSEAEVLGRHYSMFFTEDAIRAGKPQRELERAKLDGRYEEEGWRVRKIGPQFWANVVLTPIYHQGVLRGYVKVTRDLSERKAAEDALRQSQQWLLTTLQSIGDAVIATDAAGDVKFINPIAQSLTGWKEDEATGRPLDKVFVIVNQETRNPVTSPFYKVISTGGVIGLANHTVLIARDGTEHAIADSAAPILDHKGDIVGVVIVFRVPQT
ncbi:MAG TPA: PAS domain S-box protein [Nitrospiraceae bacterium]|nr:PAS domain S-box protein [Nitrospiraceae bacterium]